MKKKLLALDLEIYKPIPPGEPDWKKYRPLGITVIALKQDDCHPLLFYSRNEQGEPEDGPMDDGMLDSALAQIKYYLDKGCTLLTWNGLYFDLDVLAEHAKAEHKEWLAQAAVRYHVDMMLHFLCIKGYPLGLDAAARGVGLPGKPEGLDGALAPILWQSNDDLLRLQGRADLAELSPAEKRHIVLKYVTNDVEMTMTVGTRVEEQRFLEWTSQKGRKNTCEFPNGWLTVEQALRLPEPDVGWIANPWKREDTYRWTGYKL